MATWLLALIGAATLDGMEELFHWFRRDTSRFWRMIETVATPWIGSPTFYWGKANGLNNVKAATEALEASQNVTVAEFEALTREPYHHAAHRHTIEAEREYGHGHAEAWRDE